MDRTAAAVVYEKTNTTVCRVVGFRNDSIVEKISTTTTTKPWHVENRIVTSRGAGPIRI